MNNAGLRRGDPSALREALWASADVTAVVAALAALAPPSLHATLVGLAFLSATWILVWRRDDEAVRRAGLALGGLVLPERIHLPTLFRQTWTTLGWVAGAAALVALPFLIGFRFWWAPRFPFALRMTPAEAGAELLGQVLVIALPEEAFYRGYLQSRLDEAWPARARLLGASVGPGLVVGATIFALGHLVTVPNVTRLAVFFPALAFGWLRARTGGIAASVGFHAFCNVYAELLGRGYGLF